MSATQTLIKGKIEERAGLVKSARAILDKADAEKRGLSAEETQEYERIDGQIEAISADVERRQRLQRHADWEGEPAGRQTDPEGPESRRTDATEPNPQRERFDPSTGRDRDPQSSDVVRIPFAGRKRGLAREAVLRPGTPEHARYQDAYRERFAAYISGGVSAGLMVGSDPKGGYLAPTTMSSEVIKFLDDMVFMRGLATVLPPLAQAVSIGVPSWDADPGDADWTAEVPASDISEDDTAAVGKREMTPHLCTKLVKLSMKLLRSSIIDIESYIAQRLAYKFGITEEKAFLTGSGAQRPLGVFTASAQGISTGRDVTCTGTTAFTADEVIDLMYFVKDQYRERGTLLCHREFLKRARKLKTGDGQYLWQPGMAAGQPSTIFDRPYVSNENAPSTFTTGQYIAVYGDFSFYWIVDALSLEVQRLGELFALKNQIGLLGRKETDGMPVLEEAFSRLKLA